MPDLTNQAAKKPLSPTAQAMENFLLAAYETHPPEPLEIRQADLASSMGVSGATIRRAGRLLIESGRWAIRPGVGHQATTYEPLPVKEAK